MSPHKESTVFFPIVWHAHQPRGNFSWVIEEAYQKSYLPLIQTIEKYPTIKMNMHFSGSLLEWLQENHPEFLEQVVTLSHRQQLEIIGGGFFEPILAILPDEDKEKQIQLMIDWWMSNYNIEPNGFWLAERVWVPSLPPILAKMGIEFTFIDDYLFRMAGFSKEQTFYAYVTEDQGKKISILPINEDIRYLIPWKDPEKTIQYLRKNCGSHHEKIIVMISDVEKMGVWPAGDRTTYDICYINGYDGKPWMESFFEAILYNQWIKPVLISHYLKENRPKGLIYLPTGSYDRMATWALPTPLRKRLERLQQRVIQEKIDPELADDIRTFTTGSFWKNFLIKYSQANIMHKRMLVCRNKVKKIEERLSHLPADHFQLIWKNILTAQENDAFWHGLFGGVYYRFLRHATHKNIIKAEYFLDSICEKEGLEISSNKVKDILLDGTPDIILENKSVSSYISALHGGSIFALNLKERGYNFLNVLKRQIEAYHEPGIPVVQDRFEKWAFQDHFLSSFTPEALQNDTYEDLGDFANNSYEILQINDTSVTFKRKGMIRHERNSIQTTLMKTYSLIQSSLSIDYEISFSEPIDPGILFFCPEINLIAVSYPYKTTGIVDGKNFDLGSSFNHSKCQTIEIKDLNELEKVSMTITFEDPVECEIFPIMSMARSENGMKREYQGTSIFVKIKVSGIKLRSKIIIFLENL